MLFQFSTDIWWQGCCTHIMCSGLLPVFLVIGKHDEGIIPRLLFDSDTCEHHQHLLATVANLITRNYPLSIADFRNRCTLSWYRKTSCSSRVWGGRGHESGNNFVNKWQGLQDPPPWRRRYTSYNSKALLLIGSSQTSAGMWSLKWQEVNPNLLYMYA